MSINFIKKSLEKLDEDNLITFLLDVITCGAGIDSVEDFNETKVYKENEKVYYKDELNQHHIYKCDVKSSTVGHIAEEEWVDLLQTFRQPIIDPSEVEARVDVKEEVVISSQDNQNNFILTTPGIEDGQYHIVIHHPTLGRLASTDFRRSGKTIILNGGFEIPTIGSKIIVDLYREM